MLLGKNAEGEWYKRRLTFQRPSRLVDVEFFFWRRRCIKTESNSRWGVKLEWLKSRNCKATRSMEKERVSIEINLTLGYLNDTYISYLWADIKRKKDFIPISIELSLHLQYNTSEPTFLDQSSTHPPGHQSWGRSPIDTQSRYQAKSQLQGWWGFLDFSTA